MSQGDRSAWCVRFTTARPTGCGRTSCCACWRSTWSGTCGKLWEPLLFEDEELAEDRTRRDPVLPAQASESARLKKKTHQTPDGLPVQSFRTLLAHLGTRCRNTCVVTGDPIQTTFYQVTEADALAGGSIEVNQDVARNGKSRSP